MWLSWYCNFSKVCLRNMFLNVFVKGPLLSKVIFCLSSCGGKEKYFHNLLLSQLGMAKIKCAKLENIREIIVLEMKTCSSGWGGGNWQLAPKYCSWKLLWIFLDASQCGSTLWTDSQNVTSLCLSGVSQVCQAYALSSVQRLTHTIQSLLRGSIGWRTPRA